MSVNIWPALMAFCFFTVIISGCIGGAEETNQNFKSETSPYTIEEYAENEVYSGEAASPTPTKTPVVTQKLPSENPYSTEKVEIVSQSEELSILIENSTKDLFPKSDKLKFVFTSKNSVERLRDAAADIKEMAVDERKELMRLTLSEDYLVCKLKYKCFLDMYAENSDRIVKYCENMIETGGFGSDTKYDSQIRDYVEVRTEEYDEADEYLMKAKELLKSID